MPKSLAQTLAGIVLAALLVLGGHFLWPAPADPRAAPWLAQEAAYRGRVAALEHDTAQLRGRIDSLRTAGTRYYRAGNTTLSHVVTTLDTLRVVPCGDTTLLLRPFADSLRLVAEQYAAAHEADSLALVASDTLIHTLTVRLQQADNLIAGARPIIVDAKQHPRWPFVVAGAGVAVVVMRVLH